MTYSAVLSGIAAAALLLGGCTTILGDDFEVVGGQGGTGTGGTASGGGGTGGETSSGEGGASNLCGNDALDPGELCDGDCPVECIDAELCTDDHLQGSPDQCNAVCPFEVIDTCVDNDGCCPNGCYNSLDNDCYMSVLIVSAFANGVDALHGALSDTGAFGIVEVFDFAAAGAPSLDALLSYDAVLVSTNYDQFPDPAALGNVLADYYDQGGRVVLANGANCSAYQIQGRFVTDGYLALEIGDYHPGDDTIGAIELPDTPLMDGSEGLFAMGHCDGQAAEGAVTVARYETSGDPVVAYRWVQGRRRVDLNIFPPPDTGAEGVALLVNALRFQ